MPKRKAISRAIAAMTVLGSAGVPTLVAAQTLEEIVVTAQRKQESIQDVPIAVSAFGGAELEKRRLDDARDLQTAVPNLTYTGSGVAGGEGFQIRGIGNSVGGTTGDVGVGIHHNNAPQVQSRIASAESYDLERVEVLRGPQGTLYGRNATGGVINYITAKPVYEEYDFSVSLEAGNYGNRKIKSMANIPLGDIFALRIAGMGLERDGYTENLDTGDDIDDREMWSARATLGFEPTDWFRGWVLYEQFDEDDSRYSGSRTLCIPDAGPTSVGGVAVTNVNVQNYLSQGCLPGSIYQDSAYGRPNSVATFGGRFATRLGGYAAPLGNLYEGDLQSTDLRETSAFMNPETDIKHDIAEFELEFDLTSALTLSILGHQSEDEYYQRSGSYEGSVGFLPTPFTPGGVFTDYQHGSSTGMRTLNIFDFSTEQTSYEMRLQSSFDGPINFNFGLFDLDVERSQHTWVSTNTTTLFLTIGGASYCTGLGLPAGCVYFDPNPVPDYSGHQYFDTWTPYQLDSQAIFGELYYDVTDTVKLTAGLRYSDDEKERLNLDVQLLSPVGAGGIGTGGYPASAQRVDKVDFQEWTGRLVLDWMPETDFTDSTLLYASYSRGYKSGGFNSPEQGVTTIVPYEPEIVNAFEIGTKNVFSGGMAQLNGSMFYYDYQDYQISKIEQFSARNENIDAKVMGLELEAIFEPVENVVLFGNLGWLKTEAKSGASIDPMDRLAGTPGYTFIRDYQVGCVAPTAVVAAYVSGIQGGTIPIDALFTPCVGDNALPGALPGFEQDLAGNELPNSPEWSAMVGLEYSIDLAEWLTTFRFDYSWKDESYTSVFNSDTYYLDSWDNANATLTFSNLDLGLDVQLYVKNLFDDDTIINHGVGSDGVGLTRNVTLLDPRLFGVNVTYNF